MLAPDSRGLFFFPTKAVYLNHGGFGVMPREVMEYRFKKLREIEANPTGLFGCDFSPVWHQAVASIAARFSVRKEDFALTDNVTDAANAVMRSVPLLEGDEILMTSFAYGALHKAAVYIAGKQGAKVTQAELRFPNPHPEQFLEAVRAAITPRTKLAVFDHISAATALVMPVAEMTKICRAKSIPVLVDGAHVPGNIAFDINAVGADWYIGSLHKWYFVPRGCGFLWAAPHRQERLLPTIMSWHIDKPFPHNFEWTGTRDPTPWLCAPEAFAFMDRLGEENVRRHNHDLIRQGVALLANAWNFKVFTPDAMTSSMTLVPLPENLHFQVNDEGRKQVERELRDKHSIAVSPSFMDEKRIWIRISAQIYNDISDYEKLARAFSTFAGSRK